MLLGEINICTQATSPYVAVGKFYEQMMGLVQSRSWEPQQTQSFKTSQFNENQLLIWRHASASARPWIKCMQVLQATLFQISEAFYSFVAS